MVASIFGPLFADSNMSVTVGIGVTGLTGTTNGTWMYSIDGGTTWDAFGSVSTSKPQTLAGNALIRFVPKKGFLGTVMLKALAWDGGKGFSKTTLTASLMVDVAPELNE
jgi:hypothetical protein